MEGHYLIYIQAVLEGKIFKDVVQLISSYSIRELELTI